MTKKLDLGEEHVAHRATLGGITENFFTQSTSEATLRQVLDTFADCRKCGGFTEFTETIEVDTGVARFKTLCWRCSHRDGFTSKTTKNNMGGFTIQVTWDDKSESPSHLSLVKK